MKVSYLKNKISSFKIGLTKAIPTLTKKNYVKYAIPSLFIIILSIYYKDKDFLYFVPVIWVFELLFKKRDEVFSNFIIRLFATCFGIFLAGYISHIETYNKEKQMVIKYIEVGQEDLIMNMQLADTIYKMICNDTTSVLSIYAKKEVLNPPNHFFQIINYDVCLRNISIQTRTKLFSNISQLSDENKTLNDTAITFHSKKYNLLLYLDLMYFLYQYCSLEISYLKNSISEDSLNIQQDYLSEQYRQHIHGLTIEFLKRGEFKIFKQ